MNFQKILDKVNKFYLKLLKKDKVSYPEIKERVKVSSIQDKIDWGLQSTNIPEIWNKTMGDGIKICILDTGSPIKHKDLKNAVVKHADFTNSSYEDKQGHGTHVSGIAAARANNRGIVGVAPLSELYIGKVLDDDGSGNLDWLVEGIKWAIEESVDIISISLGSPSHYRPLKRIVEKAIDKNIIVIAAAGNEGKKRKNTVNYPGRYENVITVGSYNEDLVRSNFSSCGPHLDLLGPGEDVLSTWINNSYKTLDGTSMATPFIAGIAALALSKHRKQGGETELKTQKQMRQHLLKMTVDKMSDRNDVKGYGILDSENVVENFKNED